jgi:mannose-6-phosphate isomerase-like protein (cupin superfamily)
MKILAFTLAFLLACPALGRGQTPTGVEYQSATALRDAVAGAATAPSRTATRAGTDRGRYSYIVVRRDQPGEVEIHELLDDVFVVQEGAATLRYGGTASGSRVTAPGERRGGQISGGTTQRITVGDLVIVPAGVPHQVEVEPGSSITYLVVKVSTGAAARVP